MIGCKLAIIKAVLVFIVACLVYISTRNLVASEAQLYFFIVNKWC